MKKIFWIGSRESDISNEDLFYGSITRFGNDKNNNISFCNNTKTDSYKEFVSFITQQLICKDPNIYFIFANELLAYQCSEEVFRHALCINKLSTIEAISNKIFSRNYIGKVVNVPECIVINASSASDTHLIKSIFNNSYDRFVIQSPFGAGGEQTLFLSNYKSSNMEQVLITPYIENAIPINVHIAISDEEYRIFPPSIQIILNDFNYSGSDYIKFQELDNSIKAKILITCNQIAKQVCKLKCNGIFGVDLLIKSNEVIFLECNYRYQGSSFLLNKFFIENGYPSLFRIQYNSFYQDLRNVPENIYYIPINYSSFRRTINNSEIVLPKPYEIKKDGLDLYNKLRNGYIQYEIYNQSIIDLIQK